MLSRTLRWVSALAGTGALPDDAARGVVRAADLGRHSEHWDVRKVADRGQDLRGAIAILDMTSMHLHANQMPAGIGDDVAFAPLDLLARVITPRPPAFPWS